MPHHGKRQRKNAVTAAPAQSRRRSRNGSAPSEREHDHDDPVEVVDPRDRGEQAGHQPDRGHLADRVTGEEQPARQPEAEDPDHRDAREPDDRAGQAVGPYPEEEPPQRLVRGPHVGPQPGRVLQRPAPEREGRLRQQHPRTHGDPDRGADGSRCLLPPAGDEEVHDEHAGRELDGHREPDEHASGDVPQDAGPWLAEVHEAREHDEGVHLAEPDAVAHRVQPQHRGGERGEDEGHPGPGAVDEAVSGIPDDRRRGGDLEGGPEPPGRTERHERQRDGEDRRERRVGERQELRRLGEGGVDRSTAEDRHARLAVDLDVDLPLVERPEDEVAEHDGHRRQGDEEDREEPPVARRGAARWGGHRTIVAVTGASA